MVPSIATYTKKCCGARKPDSVCSDDLSSARVFITRFGLRQNQRVCALGVKIVGCSREDCLNPLVWIHLGPITWVSSALHPWQLPAKNRLCCSHCLWLAPDLLPAAGSHDHVLYRTPYTPLSGLSSPRVNPRGHHSAPQPSNYDRKPANNQSKIAIESRLVNGFLSN